MTAADNSLMAALSQVTALNAAKAELKGADQALERLASETTKVESAESNPRSGEIHNETAVTIVGAADVAVKPHAQVSNADFMRAIFDPLEAGEYCWQNSFMACPSSPAASWGGQPLLPRDFKDQRANSYFSVALLTGLNGRGKPARTKATFSRLICVVLDDIKDCDLAPTWRIETSPGNYQIGFKLSDPVTDVGVATRLHKSLGVAGIIGNDKSGNNPVRYVRLPVGCNSKYSEPFATRLDLWSPENTVTLSDLCDALGLSYRSIMGLGLDFNAPVQDRHQNTTVRPPVQPQSHSERDPMDTGDRQSDEELIGHIIKGDSYHDPLLKLTARYAHRGMDLHSIIATVKAFMEVSNDDSERWKNRARDIERITRDAVSKFAPKDLPFDSATHPYAKFCDYDIDNLEATEFVLDGLITAGISEIFGAPGVGKTTILVPLAARVAGLCDPLDPLNPTLRRRVVYCTEDKSQVVQILRSMKESGEIVVSTQEMKEWFRIVEGTRMPAKELVKVASFYLDEQKLSHTVECVDGTPMVVNPLVVLDTTSATIELESENDNSEISDAVGELKRNFRDISVILVGHTAKVLKNTKDPALMSGRGGGAWEGDARQVMYLFNLEDDTRWLEIGDPATKHRFVTDFAGIKFTMGSAVIDGVDQLKRPVKIKTIHGVPQVVLESEREAMNNPMGDGAPMDTTPMLVAATKLEVLRFIKSLTDEGGWIGEAIGPAAMNINKKAFRDGHVDYPHSLRKDTPHNKLVANGCIKALIADEMLYRETRQAPGKNHGNRKREMVSGLWLTERALIEHFGQKSYAGKDNA